MMDQASLLSAILNKKCYNNRASSKRLFPRHESHSVKALTDLRAYMAGWRVVTAG